MGQYHIVANLDKLEFLNPHTLGAGLKQWEQLANAPGTGAALLILIASASTGAGGGDFNSAYEEHLEKKDRVIGRWRGDRIVMVGDYDDDVKYQTQCGELTGAQIYMGEELPSPWNWVDISDNVAHVIERELDGKYSDQGGWRSWKPNEEPKAA